MTEALLYVPNRTWVASGRGLARARSFRSGNPIQGTTMDHASTQRWRYTRSSMCTSARRLDSVIVIGRSTSPSITIVQVSSTEGSVMAATASGETTAATDLLCENCEGRDQW
jgi:hypothetical protein